mmetsp:Transcript_14707/g.24919  ORF Transcript_14707/g.24919 Transcript_14707/m.24919 type:complete len:222 (-) Transcript_14707:5-670(-)
MHRCNSAESLSQLLVSAMSEPPRSTQRSTSLPQNFLVEALAQAVIPGVIDRSSPAALDRSPRQHHQKKRSPHRYTSKSRSSSRDSATRRSKKRNASKSKSPSRDSTPNGFKKQQSRLIPRTSNRPLYHGPIPRWIDVSGHHQDTSVRRKRVEDPGLMPLSDVAMILSSQLENAIAKGLFNLESKAPMRTESEVVDAIAAGRKRRTKFRSVGRRSSIDGLTL